MTLDEFQFRLRAICDAYVASVLVSMATYDRGLDQLADDVGETLDERTLAAITSVEINRMQAAFDWV